MRPQDEFAMPESRQRLPPNQQVVAPGKWPPVGERSPLRDGGPWQVEVCGAVERPQTLSLAELQSLPHTALEIDIHCVTRWTRFALPFRGVLLAEVLRLARPTPAARFASFVAHSERGHSTSLPLDEAVELGALVAWEADGLPLPEVHGGPVRTVVPGRYFFKSLKWLRRVELLPEDRLGYWEAEAGYHNRADPWREERYMAPDLDRQLVRRLIEARDFSGLSLRSIAAAGRDLAGLKAARAILRDADFRGATLTAADFTEANLSNACLQGADLRGANFQRADLEGADFAEADLRGADLRGASLFGATFLGDKANSGARFDAATQITPDAIEALVRRLAPTPLAPSCRQHRRSAPPRRPPIPSNL
jgi:DMSO/TMAO reductase YedYZ molybdopterin-dependent catalytic subunit